MANVAVSILTLSDEPAWQAYVNAHPDATIYHTLEWRDILYNEYRFEPVYLMAKEGEKVAGILPLFLLKNLRGRRLVSLPFSIYGGPIYDSDEGLHKLLDYAKAECEKKGARLLRVRAGGAEMGGPKVERYVSSVLRIDAELPRIWDGFKYNTRTAIRRAQKHGLTFDFNSNDVTIRDFYLLQLMSRKRQGLPTPPLRYYRAIVDGLKCRARFAVVREGDVPLAGGLLFAFRDAVLFAQGASDYRHQNLRPNDLLIWEVIRWAKNNGFRRFDFGLTPRDDEELLFFKRKWGAVSIPYYDCVYPETEKRGRYGLSYNAGSAIFRILPLWASARVGSTVIRYMG